MPSNTTLRWPRRGRAGTMDFMHAILLGLLALGGHSGPPTTQAPLAPLPHVRPLDPLAADLLSTGTRSSSTFAGLLAGLDQSGGFVVYVTTSPDPERRGSIVFVSRAAGVTYLLVRVCTRQNVTDRIAVLAHELEHATEIAAADPPVASEQDLHRLYTCIGIDSTGQHLESEAAVRTERAVHHELVKRP
jgi:hypothetical protein